jgi:hypothetical protein
MKNGMNKNRRTIGTHKYFGPGHCTSPGTMFPNMANKLKVKKQVTATKYFSEMKKSGSSLLISEKKSLTNWPAFKSKY